jgi:hypothetical protein
MRHSVETMSGNLAGCRRLASSTCTKLPLAIGPIQPATIAPDDDCIVSPMLDELRSGRLG